MKKEFEVCMTSKSTEPELMFETYMGKIPVSYKNHYKFNGDNCELNIVTDIKDDIDFYTEDCKPRKFIITIEEIKERKDDD